MGKNNDELPNPKNELILMDEEEWQQSVKTIEHTQQQEITVKYPTQEEKLVLDLRHGFLELETQTNELITLYESLSYKLEEIGKELNLLREEQKDTERLKEAYAYGNQKHFLKREPVTHKIYDLLIEAAKGPAYKLVRLRIAFCLLTLTGI